jgi:2-keto-4-pentenoate hydratase/2-oxohepta-3-ene-1,7-dioic acid hydratase in catechol pathway
VTEIDREAPFYFTKAAEHYAPSGSTVPYPPGTANYHYELELVVVMRAPAFRIAADRALDCVFGYALIYTGTPEGVGPVNTGDVLEGAIEGVGSIRLTIGPAE